MHAAYTADGARLAGTCAAVPGPPAEAASYALPAAAGPGLGHVVKQTQRAWPLGRGVRALRLPRAGHSARTTMSGMTRARTGPRQG
ncbi:hypothetical protein ACWD5Q_29720 [Streptomyces sp. NPDC002513]